MEVYLPLNSEKEFSMLEERMNQFFASTSGEGYIPVMSKDKNELREFINKVQPSFDYKFLGAGRREDYFLVKIGANI